MTTSQEARNLQVLVVDDQPTFAEAIALAIDTQADLHCVGEVATAEEAIASVDLRCPDVVLLDLALPGMGGIEAIGRLKHACPDLRVVVLTANTSGSALLAAVEAGADAFLPKEQRFSDVLDAIRNPASALNSGPHTLANILHHAGPRSDRDLTLDIPALTEREHQVLLLLADGLAVSDVSERLGISVNTCRGHVRALLSKLDVHSQLAAVVKAVRAGLLPTLGTRGG